MSGASCTGCGDCCRVVQTSWTKVAASRMNITESDRKWVSEKLHRLTRAEAEQLRPSLRLEPHSTGTHYYRCDNFDYATSRCTVHGTPEKPDCCTGFPWYGKNPLSRPGALDELPRCPFQIDLSPLFILGLA